MDIRGFAEAVGFANFTRIAMAVGTVLSFDERRVDLIAYRLAGQDLLDAQRITEDDAIIDLRHASFVSCFVYRGIS